MLLPIFQTQVYIVFFFSLISQTVQFKPNTFWPIVFLTFLNSIASVSQEVLLDEKYFLNIKTTFILKAQAQE